MVSTSTSAIYAFSSITISMVTVVTYIGVMFLIAVAVGYPLAFFLNKIHKFLNPPTI